MRTGRVPGLAFSSQRLWRGARSRLVSQNGCDVSVLGIVAGTRQFEGFCWSLLLTGINRRFHDDAFQTAEIDKTRGSKCRISV